MVSLFIVWLYMKILYCCQHPGCVLKALAHKFRFHPNDSAIFFVEGLNLKDYSNLTFIKYNDGKNVYTGQNTTDLLDSINQYINSLLVDNRLSLFEFNEIYTIYDLNNIFSLFFSMNSISYSIIESCPDLLIKCSNKLPVKDSNRYSYDILSTNCNSLDGKNKNVKRIYTYSPSSSNKYLINSDLEYKVVIFDYLEALSSMLNEHKSLLNNIYSVTRIDKPTYIYMLSSVNFTYTYLAKFKPNLALIDNNKESEVYRFYFTILDYYFEDVKTNNFYIKPHPTSTQKYIDKYRNFQILSSLEPIELLANDKTSIISVGPSTACDILKAQNVNVVNFGNSFFNFYFNIEFCYASFEIIKFLSNNSKDIINIDTDVDTEQLSVFLKYSSILKDFNVQIADIKDGMGERKYHLITDEKNLSSIQNNNDYTILTSIKPDYCFSNIYEIIFRYINSSETISDRCFNFYLLSKKDINELGQFYKKGELLYSSRTWEIKINCIEK